MSRVCDEDTLGFPADQSGPAGAEAEIARLEAVWNDSHVKGDGAALDRLWADDFTVAVPAMRMMSKADVIGVWRTGRMKFQRYGRGVEGGRVPRLAIRRMTVKSGLRDCAASRELGYDRRPGGRTCFRTFDTQCG